MQTIEPSPGQYLELDKRPDWFRNWEKTGLLAIEDKNGDGRIQYSADPESNELVTLDRDILVLANPEIAQLPNWVIALVAAGGLAAALSTAAGLLLAISSAISHDLLKSTFMPSISEKAELNASRGAMALAIAGCRLFGFASTRLCRWHGWRSLLVWLHHHFSPALMMGIFSTRVTREGAVGGMLAGIGITLFYVFPA